ncbi:MAG: amino acid adenylation domain-containing protein, partial [Acidobacteriota bacterium]
MAPHEAAYNIFTGLRLEGDLNIAAMQASLTAIVQRHESLRTCFPQKNGIPVQHIQPPTLFPLPLVDLQGLPEDLSTLESIRLADQEARRPFDLAQGPVIRATLVLLPGQKEAGGRRQEASETVRSSQLAVGSPEREPGTSASETYSLQPTAYSLSGKESGVRNQESGRAEPGARSPQPETSPLQPHSLPASQPSSPSSPSSCLLPPASCLLLNIHHIASDGWSTGVLLREFSTFYRALSDSELRTANRPLIPPLPIQYSDYAAWQRGWLHGEALQEQMDYWKQNLKGAPPSLELPSDRPRPAQLSRRGGALGFSFEGSLLQDLKKLSRRHDSTLFMTLLAAFQALLSRHSGQAEICVGTPVANRNQAETEGLVGFFVNTLVMRSRLDPGLSLAGLLAQVRQTALGAYAHQDIPFEQVVDALQPDRALDRTPLFQVMFALQNAPLGTPSALQFPGLRLSLMPNDSPVAKFDLSLTVDEPGGALSGGFEYSAELFDSTTVRRMIEQWRNLLQSCVADPDRPLSQLPLSSPSEIHQIVVEWGSLPAGLVEERKAPQVGQWIEAHLPRLGDSIGVTFEDQSLSHAELLNRADRVAGYLQSKGAGPEKVVGLCLERSLGLAVGLLGILRSGAAYMPLDPAYPEARLAFMLEDSAAAMVLTEQSLIKDLPLYGLDAIQLDRDWQAIEQGGRSSSPGRQPTGANLPYIIYTSGTTGQPKGVAVAQSGLANMAQGQLQAFGVSHQERILQFFNISFDASLFEISMAWRAGATLCLATRHKLVPGPDLAAQLRLNNVTTVTLPPSALAALPTEALPALKTLIVGTEACPAELVARWAPRTRFFNVYGPTEATVWASSQRCRRIGSRPPIGRPFANVSICLLDRNGSLAPLGVAAELHIGGAAVARGYHNRPSLTAEKFIPDAFSGRPGARLYCSGDRVRHLQSGEIDFLGRIDHQMKVRGYRIEPGEIESALTAHPAVVEASAAARKDSSGSEFLVAYLASDWDPAPQPAELKSFLEEQLPVHMVPSVFVVVEELPHTPSNKVDRKALQGIELAETRRGEYVAPRTPDEELLASILSDVLGAGKVGVHDNFFELGGHSLLATQVVSRVRQAFKVDLPLRRLFEAPSVASLAQRIGELRRSESFSQRPALEPVKQRRGLPLSFAQQRLWFLDQLDSGNSVYNIPVPLRLEGELHLPALRQALNEIIRRHESLRTCFPQQNGVPVQHIHPPSPFPLPLVDLGGLPEKRSSLESQRLAEEESKRPFSLAQGPLIRAALLLLPGQKENGDRRSENGRGEFGIQGPKPNVSGLESETSPLQPHSLTASQPSSPSSVLRPPSSVLLLNMHHIVSDGWSTGVLVREMTALYQFAVGSSQFAVQRERGESEDPESEGSEARSANRQLSAIRQ